MLISGFCQNSLTFWQYYTCRHHFWLYSPPVTIYCALPCPLNTFWLSRGSAGSQTTSSLTKTDTRTAHRYNHHVWIKPSAPSVFLLTPLGLKYAMTASQKMFWKFLLLSTAHSSAVGKSLVSLLSDSTRDTTQSCLEVSLWGNQKLGFAFLMDGSHLLPSFMCSTRVLARSFRSDVTPELWHSN